MPDVVDRLGATLLDASLAATAILGLVILVIIQSSQPARRRGWARAGLLAALALLPLSALNFVPRYDLWRPLLAILPATLDEPGPPPSARGRDATDEIPDFGDPSTTDACEAGPNCGGARRPGWLRRIGRIVVLGYGAGAALGLGWLGLGLWGSGRLIRMSWAPSAEALALFGSLPFARGRSRPRLLVSDRPGRPVLLGILRPTILIPADLDQPEVADRLRLGLLHELAHAETADHLFGPAGALAGAIWFFLPPVWWILERMRLDSEFLADSRAAAHFGPSGRYASSLVDLASARVVGPAETRPIAPGRVPRGARTSALFVRIVMLLKCPYPIEDRPPAWWRWSTAVTIAAATLAASCLTLRGIAGWSEGVGAAAVMEPARSFRLPTLVIAPGAGDDSPFDLRVRLPEQFTLSLEIMADPADLPAIEVLGHRLGPPAGAAPVHGASRLWHRVDIRRSDGREEVRVDDAPVDPEGAPRKQASWLTIRAAPGRAARIRALDMAW